MEARKNLFLISIFLLGFSAVSLCLKPPAWVEGGLEGFNPSGRMYYSAIQSSNKRDLWLFGGFDGNNKIISKIIFTDGIITVYFFKVISFKN